MKTNSLAERIALNPKRQRLPIKYWQAVDKAGRVVAENNSIALLRYQFGKTLIYKAVR